MKYHAFSMTHYPDDPMPWGIDVWDILNNERAESLERKFKTRAEAVAYRKTINDNHKMQGDL
jgi:hypothetical protein